MYLTKLWYGIEAMRPSHVVVCCLAYCFGCLALVGADSPARGIRVEGVEPLGLPNSGNSALFVGVNDFEDDSLRPLRFAVNDAISQAHLFILELKLIPPANAVVLITGEPSTTETRTHKTALEKAGVRVEKATRSRVFNELGRAAQLPQDKADLVIISLSSHGFEEGGVPYVMPSDGSRAFLGDTGLSLRTFEQRLERSKAGKRLLIIDACREKATGDDRSLGRAMDVAWRTALGESRGQAVLASCDVGQFSFEDPRLGHGVFTHHLLKGLTGEAAADSRGFITLGHVSDYVSRSVNEWVTRNKLGSSVELAQKPWYKGPNDARDIPLAVSRATLGLLRDAKARKRQALDMLTDARKAQRQILTVEIESQVEQSLEKLTDEKQSELLDQIETLKEPRPAFVKSFVVWWKTEGLSLGGSVAAGKPRVQPALAETPSTPHQELPPTLYERLQKAESLLCTLTPSFQPAGINADILQRISEIESFLIVLKHPVKAPFLPPTLEERVGQLEASIATLPRSAAPPESTRTTVSGGVEMTIEQFRVQLKVEDDGEWTIIRSRIASVLGAWHKTSRNGKPNEANGALLRQAIEGKDRAQIRETVRKVLTEQAASDEREGLSTSSALTKAQSDLREVLTAEQEAVAMLLGLLR